MKSSTTYVPNQSFAVLIQGPPGSGKTTLAGHFPKPYILDVDNNLSGAHRLLTEKKIPYMYDIVDIQDDGKPTADLQHWPRMMTLLEAAKKSPDIETIVIDGATKFFEYAKVEVMRASGNKSMEFKDWDTMAIITRKVINNLRTSGKIVIMTAHEAPEKDEVGGVIKYFLAVQGQMKNTLAGIFSDNWRCEVNEKGAGHEFQVRTMPNYRCQLKNSLGLPATFVMDWKIVAEKLKRGMPLVNPVEQNKLVAPTTIPETPTIATI